MDRGEQVRAGDPIGQCGNSGTSTEPHVHVQVTDSVDWVVARGLPLAFREVRGEANSRVRVPGEGEIVEGG